MKETDPKIFATFTLEVEDYLNEIGAYFSSNPSTPAFEDGYRELRDTIHNLRGVAGMVGVDPMAKAAGFFLELLTGLQTRRGMHIGELDRHTKPVRAALRGMLAAMRTDDTDGLGAIWENLRGKDDFHADTAGETSGLSMELKELFLSEASEYLDGMRPAVDGLMEKPDDPIERSKLYRYLINLKGSAAMVNLSGMGSVLARFIDVFEMNERGELELDESVRRFFFMAVDTARDLLEDFRLGRPDTEARSRVFDEEAVKLVPALGPAISAATAEVKRIAGAGEAPGAEASAAEDGRYDDLRTILRDTFREEAAEHLDELGRLIVRAEGGERNPEHLHSLFRVVHTLKGAAATAGFDTFSKSSHRLEDILDTWREGGRKIDEALLKLLYEAERRLRKIMEFSGHDELEAERLASDLNSLITDFLKKLSQPAPSSRAEAPEEIFLKEKQIGRAVKATDTAAPTKTIRVPMERLDRLLNMVSELQGNRLRLDELTGVFGGLSKKLKWERKNMAKVTGEFQRKYHWEPPVPGMAANNAYGFSDLEFDSYSDLSVFSRNLEELDFKIGAIIKQLETLLSRFTEGAHSFSSLVGAIQEETIQARMVSVDGLFAMLHYQTLGLSRSLGKQVNVEISGEGTEIDKDIVDRIGDALMHVIRNCLDHGIESPGIRKRKGKPAAGTIRLSARPSARNVVFRIEDDGAGIDLDKITKLALKTGLLSGEEMEEKDREELLNLIFYPKISTRESAGEVSGRGVGMDAVRHTVAEMYGSILVESEPGRGARFTIKLPLTLAMQPILSVGCDPHTFSLPMNYVEIILEPDSVEIGRDERGEWMLHEGERSPLRWLANFLGIYHDDIKAGHPVVVLRNGDRRIGLLVDAATGREDVIVRPLSNILDACRHFLGANITSKGEVRLVLNVPFLFEMDGSLPSLHADRFEKDERLRVLVADDSLSVRQTIKLMLEKHGIKANTAKDGLIAWQKLHGIKPDLMIVDLEMPNLNGFELMERVRENPEFSELALLVLTSRGGDKHHRKAVDAGADGFLSKPITERKLLNTVKELLPPSLRVLMEERDPTLD